MIAMATGLQLGLSLARAKPDLRYSLEKIFDDVIARMVALTKLTDIADLRPIPRHLQGENASACHCISSSSNS